MAGYVVSASSRNKLYLQFMAILNDMVLERVVVVTGISPRPCDTDHVAIVWESISLQNFCLRNLTNEV